MNKQEKQEFEKLRMRAEAAELLLGEKDAIIEELEEALDELREELGQTKKEPDDVLKNQMWTPEEFQRQMLDDLKRLEEFREVSWDIGKKRSASEKDWNRKTPPQHPPLSPSRMPSPLGGMPDVKYRVKYDRVGHHVTLEIELVDVDTMYYRIHVMDLEKHPDRRRNILGSATRVMLEQIAHKLGFSPPSGMIIDMMVSKWEQELRKVGL